MPGHDRTPPGPRPPGRRPSPATTAPEMLAFSTGCTRLPALAVRRARPAAVPGTTVELRVLGASHQVVLERDGHEWVETLACRSGHAPFLPTTLRIPDPAPFAARYETGCTVTGHSQRGLRREVDRLLGTCRTTPHSLVVRFAGDPSALTGICAWSDGAGRLLWRAWHVHPRARRIVRSRSAVELLPPDRGPRGTEVSTLLEPVVMDYQQQGRQGR